MVYVVAIALLVGALLFFADFRARQGAGYLFQLVLFMAPAAIMLLLGLIYPAISTIFKSFFDKSGKPVRRTRELHLGLHQPGRHVVGDQHHHLGAARSGDLGGHRSRVRRLHRPCAR
ncbi:hypothetical protein AB1285_21400 [Microbacterium sp. NRRL B-14842]|uniref:hypothetical protein n=1 Tax=Microbacterium sp. NRRL B-14842 TaxID=3162881 RepID=UPI003D2934E8